MKIKIIKFSKLKVLINHKSTLKMNPNKKKGNRTKTNSNRSPKIKISLVTLLQIQK